mmetsp:Transcript_50304/g.108370  ORF Transcript_50304/g.108370 Transcript_50304/m.108370 type:complete len:181 (-) Transcript_50304:106-648(-)
MRATQAMLRLAGVGASLLIMLEGLVTLFGDFFRVLFEAELLLALHYFVEALFLLLGGWCLVCAEMWPRPWLMGNAPWLNKMSGRAIAYVAYGAWLIRREGYSSNASFLCILDILVGLSTLGVGAASAFYAYQLAGLPPALSEPALAREMQSTAGLAPAVAPQPPGPYFSPGTDGPSYMAG